MNLMILILSLFLMSCKSVELQPLPNEHLYSTDLVNGLCVEYALADSTRVTFSRVASYKLVPGGPCDHMRGFTNTGFKKVQNWVRDAIADVGMDQDASFTSTLSIRLSDFWDEETKEINR